MPKTDDRRKSRVTDIYREIAKATGLTEKQVRAVFLALQTEVRKALARGGPGEFNIPGLIKIKRVAVPGRPARRVPNPFKPGELIDIRSRPARNKVKVKPLKNLREWESVGRKIPRTSTSFTTTKQRGLASSLDQISAILSRDEAVSDDLVAHLERQWTTERPQDAEGLACFLDVLRTPLNLRKVTEAENVLVEAKRQSAADVTALREKSRHGKTKPSEARPVKPRDEGEVPPEAEPRFEDQHGWVYPVFFGSNRKLVNPADPSLGFSAGRSSLVRYGRCDVWIPAAHDFGETGNPWWWRWPRFRFSDDHLNVQSTITLPELEFWSQLRTEMTRLDDPQPQGLVFLHGYNVSFKEAAIRAAQMGFDLNVSGATAFFSWPSKGRLKDYMADTAAIEASEEAIAVFLADFVRSSGAAVVHVVAHSMGNLGLLRALQRLDADAEKMSGAKLGQVLLAAPDVDQELFLNLARLYPRFASRTTLYASRRDWALAASSWLRGHPRAGYYLPVTVAPGLDTVTVPNFNVDLLGHGYFAGAEALLYDMRDLMQYGTAPGKRQRLEQKGDHWTIRK